jgi:hypothetical protein
MEKNSVHVRKSKGSVRGGGEQQSARPVATEIVECGTQPWRAARVKSSCLATDPNSKGYREAQYGNDWSTYVIPISHVWYSWHFSIAQHASEHHSFACLNYISINSTICTPRERERERERESEWREGSVHFGERDRACAWDFRNEILQISNLVSVSLFQQSARLKSHG